MFSFLPTYLLEMKRGEDLLLTGFSSQILYQHFYFTSNCCPRTQFALYFIHSCQLFSDTRFNILFRLYCTYFGQFPLEVFVKRESHTNCLIQKSVYFGEFPLDVFVKREAHQNGLIQKSFYLGEFPLDVFVKREAHKNC